MMDREQYLTFCRSELAKVFHNSKTGKHDDKLKYRVEGLFHAAKVLGLLSQTELESLMAEQHLSVFGETIAERTKRKQQLEQLKESDPESYFDIPAIERRK